MHEGQTDYSPRSFTCLAALMPPPPLVGPGLGRRGRPGPGAHADGRRRPPRDPRPFRSGTAGGTITTRTSGGPAQAGEPKRGEAPRDPAIYRRIKSVREPMEVRCPL